MPHQSQWILTPCGTSVLTNNTTTETRNLIFEYANATTAAEIPSEDLKIIQAIVEDRSKELTNMTELDACEASAELNALTKYLRQSSIKTTYHCLLPTDTWLGQQTAHMIKQWLEQHFPRTDCEILSITGLQTKNFCNFQAALSDLSKELIERTQLLKERNIHIAFNLTGGFKAIAGFLQVLASNLADESFYIFERSDNLLRIPKLPVHLNTEKVFSDHVPVFRRIALGLSVTTDQCDEIPGTLIFTIDGDSILSALGQLQWDGAKQEIYRDGFLPPPSPQIHLSPDFYSSIAALDRSRLYELNKRMDELATYLEADNKSTAPNPKALSFKDYKTKKGTFQLYAWSDRDARRIYGHFLKNGIFQIDSLQKHS